MFSTYRWRKPSCDAISECGLTVPPDLVMPDTKGSSIAMPCICDRKRQRFDCTQLLIVSSCRHIQGAHSSPLLQNIATYVLYSLTHCPNMHTALTFAHVEGIQSMCSPTFCVPRKPNISRLSPSETIPKFVFLCGPLEGFEALT